MKLNKDGSLPKKKGPAPKPKKELFAAFKVKANNKFNNKFKYYGSTYESSITPMKMKCPEHGIFWQAPAEHLRNKHACPECSGNFIYTTESYVAKVKKIHGSKYDYSKIKYTKGHNKIKVSCKEHGVFELQAYSFLQGQGCRECGYEKIAKSARLDTGVFIGRHKQAWGKKKFDYSKTEYTLAHSPVTVTCKKHGDFTFSAYQYSNCPSCGKRNSKEQVRITKFLKRKGFNVEVNKTIDSVEYDIFLPDQKLAIEMNGVYWHSEQYRRTKMYHQKKTLDAQKAGITLLHFWDYEITNNFPLVKSMILSKLGTFKKRMYARQFEIKELPIKEANVFIEKNHLQGSCKGNSIAVGLFKKDKLFSVMTFGKSRFNKKYKWELIRFCTKRDYQVVGAASRLLKFFRTKYSRRIISYANIRFSNGALYEHLGFKFQSMSAPSYFYAKGGARISRYASQKHKLHKILENFDTNKSEKENMEAHNYFRVWDCGNLVYTLGKPER